MPLHIKCSVHLSQSPSSTGKSLCICDWPRLLVLAVNWIFFRGKYSVLPWAPERKWCNERYCQCKDHINWLIWVGVWMAPIPVFIMHAFENYGLLWWWLFHYIFQRCTYCKFCFFVCQEDSFFFFLFFFLLSCLGKPACYSTSTVCCKYFVNFNCDGLCAEGRISCARQTDLSVLKNGPCWCTCALKLLFLLRDYQRFPILFFPLPLSAWGERPHQKTPQQKHVKHQDQKQFPQFL